MGKNTVSTETYISEASTTIESAIRQAMTAGNSPTYGTMFDTINEGSIEMAALADKSPITNKKYIKDHYGNSLASIGNEDQVQSFTNYGFSADTLNWPLWLALYNDSWVFQRAIDKPAQDEITAGFTLHGNKDYSKVYKKYNRYKNDLTELLTWGALFGGAVSVILFENVPNEELAKPLKKEKIVGQRFRIYTVDRWYGVVDSVDDLVTDMRDIDFGKPKYYNITFADGTTWKVHHSYVLRYEHRNAPKLIKNGYLQGWGYSEGSHLISELARDDQLKTSITSLVNKSLIEVVKMAGMRGIFMGTDKGNETQLRKRLEMVNWGRTYNSLTFLDKDDEYQHFELTGLSGLAELMEKNMWLISSALEMQGILFGDLKGGLSQESDAFARYSKTIKRRCETYLRPVLYKFLKILFINCDIRTDDGKFENPDFDFDPLDKEEYNKQKVESIKGLSDLLGKLEEDGVISKYQYAKTIKNYINNDLINLDFSDELLNKLKLEEEQAILDTIKDIGKKRDRSPNTIGGTGEVDTLNPFGEGSRVIPTSTSVSEEEDEIEEVEEPTETSNQGEITNEEESNEG